MALHLLTARQVQTAPQGDHSDGAGLFLRVTAAGASWVFRYTGPTGRRREMGLGPALRDTLAAAGQTVATARKIADRARSQLADGIDPIDKRKADRDAAPPKVHEAKAAAKPERATLARVAREYHEGVIEPQRTSKHSAQWIASLEQGVPPEVWHRPIAEVTPPMLLDALAALQFRIPETASSVRQRLEVVFDDTIFHGLCQTDPAKAVKRRGTARRDRGASQQIGRQGMRPRRLLDRLARIEKVLNSRGDRCAPSLDDLVFIEADRARLWGQVVEREIGESTEQFRDRVFGLHRHCLLAHRKPHTLATFYSVLRR